MDNYPKVGDRVRYVSEFWSVYSGKEATVTRPVTGRLNIGITFDDGFKLWANVGSVYALTKQGERDG